MFRRFIGVFARPNQPLIIFLDDLQWLDPATLELVQHLVSHDHLRHVLLIGAYRSNEVTATHPLALALQELRAARAATHEIVLGPIELEDTERLIADAMHCETAHARSLGRLVHEKTGGNPFFIIQFLSTLWEQRLLRFDAALGNWRFDIEEIRSQGFTDNVAEFMVDKLGRLPAFTREALALLGCFGGSAAVTALTAAHGRLERELHAALWEAVRGGLVSQSGGRYHFLHDRVQEAAYALVPPDARARVHLRIGRLLAADASLAQAGAGIFEAVNQLNRGALLLDTPAERDWLAERNLAAGKQAKAASAYATALSYFAAGSALCCPDGWQRNHALCFALLLEQAECEYLTGDLLAAEERLAMLSARAADSIERAAVTCARVDLYTNLDRAERAVEVGLEYLRLVGIAWPSHPSDAEVNEEYQRIWQGLGSQSIEALIDSPLTPSLDDRATLDVLVSVHRPRQLHRRQSALPDHRAHGKPQPGARKQRRLLPRLRLSRRLPQLPLRGLWIRVSLRQARSRARGTRPSPALQVSSVFEFRQCDQFLVATRAHQLGLLAHGAGNRARTRRAHLRSLQPHQPDHRASAGRRPIGRSPGRSRERSCLRATSSLRNRRRDDSRPARPDSSPARSDALACFFRPWRVRRTALRAAAERGQQPGHGQLLVLDSQTPGLLLGR